MSYNNIFKPGNIGNCRLKNRIIMAPIGNINMADPIGRPLPKMIEYFVERAKGGTGLLTTGLVPVSFGIDPTVSEENGTTYFPRIDGTSRTRLSGWRDLVARVHGYDAKIFMQLSAGLGRVGSPEAALRFKILKSASWNKNFYIPQIPHIPFTTRKIKKIVMRFGQCAVNAKVSGFDGIQLHGHEGYLMDQLTSAPWNRRKLGRYKDKFQFGLDVVREIKDRCGEDFPIIYRIDLTQGLRESYGREIFNNKFRGTERTVSEGYEFCKALAEAGVDAFDVDKGCYDNWFWPHPPGYFKEAPFVEEMAGGLKEFFQENNIDIPVIAVGKMGNPETAEEILAEKSADFFMLGRPLLADPYWPRKVKEKREKEIIHCIGDQEGCIHSFQMGGHPCCTVNPYTGFEDSKEVTTAKVEKKVAVVGGGPAGCEAARTAHKRGHQVTLFEREDRIGGQLLVCSAMEIKHDIKKYIDNLQYRMNLLSKEGLDINYGTEVTATGLKDGYDVIICATGLRPKNPAIKGINDKNSIEARELLARDLELDENIKKVVVIGGGIVGCEVAYSLAYEKDLEVTVIETLPDLMTGVVHANRSMLLWLMMGLGSPTNREEDKLEKSVKAYTSSRVTRYKDGKIYFQASRQRKDPYKPWEMLIPENVDNPFAQKIDVDDTEELIINTDYIVLATGGYSDNSLYYRLQEENVIADIYAVGDARKPAGVWEAVNSANEVARFI